MVHKCPACKKFFTVQGGTIRQRTTFSRMCGACQEKRRQGTSKDYHRNTHLKKYGITVLDYGRMLEEQKGVCAICETKEDDKPLVVDHDHATGQVRALLCSACNSGLGFFKDNPQSLRAAIAYLEQHAADSPE